MRGLEPQRAPVAEPDRGAARLAGRDARLDPDAQRLGEVQGRDRRARDARQGRERTGAAARARGLEAHVERGAAQRGERLEGGGGGRGRTLGLPLPHDQRLGLALEPDAQRADRGAAGPRRAPGPGPRGVPAPPRLLEGAGERPGIQGDVVGREVVRPRRAQPQRLLQHRGERRRARLRSGAAARGEGFAPGVGREPGGGAESRALGMHREREQAALHVVHLARGGEAPGETERGGGERRAGARGAGSRTGQGRAPGEGGKGRTSFVAAMVVPRGAGAPPPRGEGGTEARERR